LCGELCVSVLLLPVCMLLCCQCVVVLSVCCCVLYAVLCVSDYYIMYVHLCV
jgi:hypothetical protein